ncbi:MULTISPECIES: glutamine synthetase family protein [unclassified Pseudomonas]|uniref:glutamine synthetase family protein n=1 Tax=unclassified Pseudomonas TaxID=196821 RepID=UPI00244B9794|nr:MULTISPECIES: glutamine synthetase family protein [unclassified Pseudomonas]MDG9930152.1 glutamine synthetase family protein [Pseudomonas sp. GD04042]MDH0485805.1 glutamine synthetase family protein [Pseudomonas sp. GD04015]MDH0606812.1 glutamine synthetase family protein [Pseudomonas sp. GD03869]
MRFAHPQEALDFLAAHPEVRSIELMLIDANGIPRGKLLHRDELLAVYEHGRPLPSSILALTIQGEDVEDSGLVWEVADADCWTYPLPGSLTLQPWRAIPTGQLQVSMHPEQGLPASPADPRHVLVRAIEALEADGYHPVMAVELEFYLLDKHRDANGRPQPAVQANGVRPQAPQVYGVYELEQVQPFLDDLYAACEVQGLPVRTAISEYAPGQLELTLEHRFDALQAVDEGVRYKRLVRGVANKHGLQACFMAKPFDDLAGSGLHLHVSLADSDGNNLMASELSDLESGPGTLLRHAIGGMMATLDDALAIFCPNANSFRRFQANSYAPLAKSWGVNNRTVSFRVPGGPAHSRHVEHRICGADANPYLAAAAILAGIHHGIKNQIDPGEAIVGNGYEQVRETLPTDWLTALRALEGSSWAREALGEDFLKVFLAIKWAEYRQFMGEVGEQDWRWYLTHA